jgi:hypothetical protein
MKLDSKVKILTGDLKGKKATIIDNLKNGRYVVDYNGDLHTLRSYQLKEVPKKTTKRRSTKKTTKRNTERVKLPTKYRTSRKKLKRRSLKKRNDRRLSRKKRNTKKEPTFFDKIKTLIKKEDAVEKEDTGKINTRKKSKVKKTPPTFLDNIKSTISSVVRKEEPMGVKKRRSRKVRVPTGRVVKGHSQLKGSKIMPIKLSKLERKRRPMRRRSPRKNPYLSKFEESMLTRRQKIMPDEDDDDEEYEDFDWNFGNKEWVKF